MADNLASFLWAIKQQESGGDYSVVNSGSGALGAYQVMPENLPSWTKQALGYTLTPQQYLNNPAAQDAVAQVILGGYYQQYGASGAAAMWYSGQPDPTAGYGNPPVSSYVDQVVSRMSTSSPISGTSSDLNVPVPGLGTIPIPGTGDLGSELAGGLEQGLTSALKSILGPILSFATWIFEAGLGVALIGFGAFLVIRNTEPVKAIQAATENAAKDSIPETRIVKPAKPKPAPKPEPKPKSEPVDRKKSENG